MVRINTFCSTVSSSISVLLSITGMQNRSHASFINVVDVTRSKFLLK